MNTIAVFFAPGSRAHRTACASNARQWGLALTMYLDDNKQLFPYAKIPNGTPGALGDYDEDSPRWADLAAFHAAGQGDNIWYNGLPPHVGSKPLWQYAGNPDVFVKSRSIFTCPTAAAKLPEFDPMNRIVFNYGMNYKGITGLTGVLYGVNFNVAAVQHPSAFVFLSDVRAHSTETPFYGSKPLNEIGCSHCWVAQLSSRHDSGENLNFADGHFAYFRYSYVCSNALTKATDPGRPDINWTFDGQRVP